MSTEDRVGSRRSGVRSRSQSLSVTTTPGFEVRRITEYLGIVAGEAIPGANLFNDIFAGIRDLVGGRSAAYEKELQKAQLGRWVAVSRNKSLR